MLSDQQKQAYKQQIKQYLHGISYPMKQTDALRCKCPTHNDVNPTAIVYGPEGSKGPGVFCPACNEYWDIFAFVEEIQNIHSFPEIVKEVQRVLGGEPEYKDPPKQRTHPTEVVAVTVEEGKKIFTRERALQISEFIGKKWGEKHNHQLSGVEAMQKGYGDKITGAWPYKNENGLIEVIDFRFEGGPRKKNVISFYYNGKSMKSSRYPIKVYNRDLLKEYPDHTILIVEGAKTAKIGMALVDYGFLTVTWNGGTAKIDRADWSCVHGRNVYFFPDDDQKTNKRTGKLLRDFEQPGLKAAKWFGDEKGALVNDWKIVPPFIKARDIKSDGADLEEVLQILSPEECAKYINESIPYEFTEKKQDTPPPINTTGNLDRSPFRILGTAEDGESYFMDQFDRLYSFKIESINRNKLSRLAPLAFWMDLIGTNKMSNDDWMQCCDDIIQLAGQKDFSIKNTIRGRGAWREPDGRISYFDGKDKFGQWDDSKVYLRKIKRDIGIGSGYLTESEIESIINATRQMSFKEKVHMMRLLGWAALAPFSGALEYRPQIMITGPSNSGKSKIEQLIARKISKAESFSGGSSSPAGYLFDRKDDAGATTIEELENNTDKERFNRDGFFLIMRQSTSDDTPRSVKGTSDQKSVSYMTRDMICFVSISAEIENVADENRITWVETKEIDTSGKKWGDVRLVLEAEITPERCAKLRNMVWEKLPEIRKYSDIISVEIQNQTDLDHRFAISEGTLMAAWLIVWKGESEPSEELIKRFVTETYKDVKPEKRRNEAEEIIEQILQEKVRVYGERQKEYSVFNICAILRSKKIESINDTGSLRDITKQEEIELRIAIENNGIYVKDDCLAIANNHKEIKRILRRPSGYAKTIKRHPKCIDSDHNVNRHGKNKKCSLFDVLEDIPKF